MIEVPDNVFYMSPLENELVFKCYQWAKKYKWQRGPFIVAPRKLTKSEIEERRLQILHGFYKPKKAKKLYQPPILYPSEERYLCDECFELYPESDMFLTYLKNLDYWAGTCKACMRKQEKKIKGYLNIEPLSFEERVLIKSRVIAALNKAYSGR